MNVRRLLAGAAFGVASFLAAGQARAFDFSDTSVSLTYGASYVEPGVTKSSDPNNGTPISKFIGTITHFDTYNTARTSSTSTRCSPPTATSPTIRPAAPLKFTPSTAATSAAMPSSIPRRSVSDPLPMCGWNSAATGIPRTPPSPRRKKLLIIGPNFAMDLPKGFLNLGFHFSKEWNNCGLGYPICNPSAVSFHPAFEFEAVFLYPLSDYLWGLPIRFDGFFNLVTPKGIDGTGQQTKTEILTQPRLVLDVGALTFKKPNTLDAYVGYQFWLNKFGNPANEVPGSEASLVFVGTTFHF